MNFLFTKTPLLYLVQSFWRDEAFTYALSKHTLLDIFVLTSKDFNPPLYYFIIHFWMKIFGSSEIAIRSFSLIMYWSTLYVCYLFLINIFKISSKKSLLYLLFIACNPFLLYYAFEARMYAMLAFMATLSYYAFIKSNRRLYLAATLLGLYTHYFMIFVFASQLLIFLIHNPLRFNKKQIIPHLMPFVYFIPWIAFVLKSKNIGAETFWIAKNKIGSLLQIPGIVFTGYESDFNYFGRPVTTISLILISLVIIGLFYLKKKKKLKSEMTSVLFAWAIGIPVAVFAVSFIKPLFLSRYFIFCTVGFCLLLVYLFEHMPKTLRYFSLIIVIFITFKFSNLQLEFRKKSNLRKIISEIKYLSNKNDVMYIVSELDYFPAQYYFDDNRVFIYGKSYEDIPNFVGKVLIPKDKVISSLPVYPQKAFVLTSDTHYDIQSTH